MLTGWKNNALLAGMVLLAGTCFAQNQDGLKHYKLDFVVKEVDGGKVVNSRAYSMIASTDASHGGSMRTNSVMQVPTPAGGTQRVDVGVNIDCSRVQELADGLAMSLSAEVNSLQQEGTGTSPVIRRNNWSSGVVVPLGKPTTVFSSEDATSKHLMQLELLATPIK